MAKKDGVLHPDPVAPVLGLRWDTSDDCLTYRKYDATPPEVLTKREVVKRISTLYDPPGTSSTDTCHRQDFHTDFVETEHCMGSAAI